MATATTSFEVTCPFCGDPDETVRINLNDLDELECSGCSEQFSLAAAVAKAAERLGRWQALARWVEMAGAALADAE